MPQKVVDSGEIEIHLAGVLRLERAHFEIDDHEASKLEVVEQQVDLKIFAADFNWILAAYESEANSELNKKLASCASRPCSRSRS